MQNLFCSILDFTEQLNRLAEAFHKYEIDEVLLLLLLLIHYFLMLGPGLSTVCRL